MYNLIIKYQAETCFGAKETKKSNLIADKMFFYFDKMIKGIIHSSKNSFAKF